MYVAFQELPADARVWVYQSDRKFSADEVGALKQLAKQFLDSWEAHGKPLRGSFELFHDQFLVVSVDETFNPVTGCSIDSSVALIHELEKAMNVSFFDRTQVAFLIDGEVYLGPMNQLKSLIGAGKIAEDTITFNNLVKNVGELNDSWKISAGNSWLKRYF